MTGLRFSGLQPSLVRELRIPPPCSRPLSSEVLDVRGDGDVVPHDQFSPAVEFSRGGAGLAFRSGFDQATHPAAARNKPVAEQSVLSITASKASRQTAARITDRSDIPSASSTALVTPAPTRPVPAMSD